MEIFTDISKTTNFKYKVVYNEIKEDLPIGPKTIEWEVNLTTKDQKKAFLIIADSASNQIKNDPFVTLIEKRHPGTNVWLKCAVPDENHRSAMLLCLQKICSDILIDLKEN